ncbi:MAG: D-glycero-beta-D-manno-heptose 1-phosphate adenylyltransferase [Planctomycetota bacterium]
MTDASNSSPTDLLSRLADWRGFRAVVIGDFMLDQLLYGDAERLSADAPVPVLDVQRQESTPGGAANLCLDLAALRGEVRAIGVTGDDTEAGILRGALDSAGIGVAGLIADPDRPTTVKRSLVGLAQARHPQKMFRVDFESRAELSETIRASLLEAFAAELETADIVCIEDYGKGVCDEIMCEKVIEHARKAGVPVFVDPASRGDFARYRGATAITPNRTEAERATGMPTHLDADAYHNAELARSLQSSLDLEAVVLTLDRHGALLLERDAEPVTVPTIAREVYDVTGAGDMMLAGLAAARANGLAWPHAVEFANAAAGLEVEQFGVAPIPFERVHLELLNRRTNGRGRLRTEAEILVELAAVRSVGKSIVFTNGCFDVLHAGHVSLLEAARSLGDFLVVGLNSDDSVARLKGPERPVNTQDDRARLLGALRAVDAVVVFDADTPQDLIERVRPDILVKGADYRGKEVVGQRFVESIGGRVELVELVPGRSTTAVIEAMRGG